MSDPRFLCLSTSLWVVPVPTGQKVNNDEHGIGIMGLALHAALWFRFTIYWKDEK